MKKYESVERLHLSGVCSGMRYATIRKRMWRTGKDITHLNLEPEDYAAMEIVDSIREYFSPDAWDRLNDIERDDLFTEIQSAILDAIQAHNNRYVS